MTKDYYELLGVSKDSSKDEIKKAYKKLALKHHPDRGGDAEKFKEISEAYAVLSDDGKKQQYDQFGHQAFDQRFSQEDIFRNANFQDIFSEMFGGGQGGSIFDMFFGGGQGGRREQRGSDLHYEMEIDFEEAAFGVEKEINFPRTEACGVCKGSGSKDGKTEKCKECDGKGQVRRIQQSIFGTMQQIITCRSCSGSGEHIVNPCKECSGSKLTSNIKELKVKIPKGVDNGNQIRISNEGEVNREGKHPGDLYVTVYVKPHEIFRREDNDIHMETSIPLSKAILGGIVKVDTLDGKKESLKIPGGTQSHTTFRLKDFGIPYVNSGGKGDQFVKVIVDIPKANKKQKEILKKFDESGKKKFGLF